MEAEIDATLTQTFGYLSEMQICIWNHYFQKINLRLFQHFPNWLMILMFPNAGEWISQEDNSNENLKVLFPPDICTCAHINEFFNFLIRN